MKGTRSMFSNSNLYGYGSKFKYRVPKQKIQSVFPYISGANFLPGGSFLLLDPILGVTLTLGNWTVPFSAWSLKQNFLLFVPVPSVAPALRQALGVQARCHLMHAECSTLFFWTKAMCMESNFFSSQGLLGPTFIPGTAQWNPLAATPIAWTPGIAFKYRASLASLE